MPQRDLWPAIAAKRVRQNGRTYFVPAAGRSASRQPAHQPLHAPLHANVQFPSVTSVLNATKPQADRDALARWRARVGTVEAQRISSGASRRGTHTHKQVKEFLLGDDWPDATASSPYWDSIAPVLEDLDVVHLVENYVFHADLCYAGRVDCVARYQDTLCVFDWKTADRPKESVKQLRDSPLQLAAYCGAINQTYADVGLTLNHAAVVVAIAHQPAEIFWFDSDDLLDYWHDWLERLTKFHRYLS